MRYNQTKLNCECLMANWSGPVTSMALLLVAFALVLPVAQAQDKKCQLMAPPASGQLPEPVKQRYSKLVKPDFAKLNLTRKSSEGSQEQSKIIIEHNNSGNGMRFQLIITNGSDEEVVGYTELDPLILNRPQLCRDGEPVSYRKGVKELVEAKDRAFPNGRSSSFALETRKSRTEEISLDVWYEPLPAGHYTLTVCHRFIWGGEWMASPSLSFEVVR